LEVAVRAAVLHEAGGKLTVEEMSPPAGSLLHVRAAGVNYADVLIRDGRYPQMPELPFVPGLEVAGDLGGRRVVALVQGGGGGYAEQAAVDPDWAFDLPDHVSYVDGAAFLLTYLTAWLSLTRQTAVRSGQTVLVHAGAGGVGSAAIQVARHLGARVVATAGSAEKQQVARDLGAEAAYGYDEFVAAGRVDHVLDPVGGTVFADSLKVLNPLGSVTAIGFTSGPWQDVSPQLLVGRNATVHGFFLGRLMSLQPQLVRDAVVELLALLGAGAFKPLVGAELALEQANDALDLLESRQSVGKVVLIP
jgi:NADPH2:quinone reductase